MSLLMPRVATRPSRFVHSLYATLVAILAFSAAQKGDAQYLKRALEAELAAKYSPELVAQALAAEYPAFGLPTPARGSEEAFYGRNHPLRKELKTGGQVLSMIEHRRYDELDAYFSKFQNAFMAGDLPEKVYADAFYWQQFEEAALEDEVYFQAWIAAAPDAWLPHAIAGLYYSQRVWATRDRSDFVDVLGEKGRRMDRYFRASRK